MRGISSGGHWDGDNFDDKRKKELDSSKLCETQIEKCKVCDYDADTLPGSYPHRKYMVCMVRNII